MRETRKMIIEAINKMGEKITTQGKVVVETVDGYVLIDTTEYQTIKYEVVGFIEEQKDFIPTVIVKGQDEGDE